MIVFAYCMIAVCLLMMGFGVYLMHRNNRIYDFRTSVLREDMIAYSRLPNYTTMMKRFWVWPLDRFRDTCESNLSPVMREWLEKDPSLQRALTRKIDEWRA